MRAMIFCAGLGTRLKPITDTIPKALVKAGNATLLEICIKNLNSQGISDIIINVHHFADQIKKFLESGKILAWGIVPTLNVEQLERETVTSLLSQWDEKVKRLESLGIDVQKLTAQSLITPSCGTGSAYTMDAVPI